MKLVIVSVLAVFKSLGQNRTKLGPKKTEKKSFKKNPFLLFRVLELLIDLHFGSRKFQLFQLM